VVTTELAGAATDFGYYFRSMVAALGDRTGWYGVFAERDPGAAHAYESGTDVPPWDVVSAVLHDLAAAVGAPLDDIEVTRARTLHRAAVAAWDAAPGAESALRARLDATTRARDMALLREREAARALERATSAPSSPAAARLANILAWARDDRERAAARCDEIRARLASFAAAPAPDWFRQGPERPREAPAPAPAPAAADWPDAFTADPGPGSRPAGHDGRTAGGGLGAAADAELGARTQGRAARGASWARDSREDAENGQAPTGKRGKGGTRPRGARFAGAFEEAPAPVAPPAEPSAPPAAGPTPRGARFAGAPEGAEPQAPAPADDPRWLAQARQEAARLGELRRTGQSGAAYVVICEAAEGPAPRLPYLVRELERTELSADVATLLWEVAALPAAPLAAAASELAAAGRAGDCRTLLHQAASRPPADLATIAGVLTSAGRHEETGELLQTLARARPPEEAAAVVKARPGLAAPLLAAAESVSRSRRRDVAAALRRASLPEA
jgi:hypothetical protein